MTISDLLAAYFSSRPFAIHKPRVPELLARCVAQAPRVAQMTPAEITAAVQAADRVPLVQMVGAVAVIPIRGCITQKSDFYSWYFGGTSLDKLTAAFRHCLHDPQVSTIVFDVDSPGGEVYGLQECFDELFAARGQKRTIALVNPFMASAAYFIGCAADEIWQMPSGQSGSIGCYTLHADISKMLADAGVAMTFIQYGEHKTDGNSYEPLSESAREELQETVNFYGLQFDRAVARGRDMDEATIKAKFGQGKMFRAPDAKRIGMIDQIGTMDTLLKKLAPTRTRGMVATAPAPPVVETPGPVGPVANAEPAPLAVETAAREDVVEPNADGECPEGYDKGDDGQCYLPQAKAKADAQRREDEDAIAMTLALSEN